MTSLDFALDVIDMDSTKVPLELNPYNAITVLSFCREFINEDTTNDYQFQAIAEAVDEFEQQLVRHLTDEQWDQINQENEINQLIGKVPPKERNR